MSKHQAWFPPKAPINTDRLCSAGSGCLPFPDFDARMRSSDSLATIGRRSGCPLTATYHRLPWSGEGLPGAWGVLFQRAAIPKPRPLHRQLAPCCADGAAAFEHQYALGSGENTISRLTHAARSFVRLRIAVPVAAHVARLTTDLPGSALIGRALHPQDAIQDFRSLPPASLPPDQPCLVTH